MPSKEIETMAAIEEALEGLEDDERQRILKWAIEKYKIIPIPTLPQDANSEENVNAESIDDKKTNGKEIPGIAILEEDKTITFTIRDLKAKNANDAGVRLALVAAYVNEKLTGNKILSRKKILKPLLGDWRIDNGNIRSAILAHRGIVPVSRYELKLDSHAKTEANKIIKEILDESTNGKWRPAKVGKKAKKQKKK